LAVNGIKSTGLFSSKSCVFHSNNPKSGFDYFIKNSACMASRSGIRLYHGKSSVGNAHSSVDLKGANVCTYTMRMRIRQNKKITVAFLFLLLRLKKHVYLAQDY
jgi:hypothetical protein